MDFLSWNDLIAGHFFQPEMAGRRVYLFVTEDVLREVGGAEADVSDFISAVKAGPPNVTRQGLCQRALQIMEGWRAKNFPLYLQRRLGHNCLALEAPVQLYKWLQICRLCLTVILRNHN